MAGTNVPGLNNTPQISQNVAGAQFPHRQEFGKVGKATEEIGQAISQDAQEGGQIVDEIQRQHDISTSSNAAAQLSVRHSQMRDQIAMSSADGFVRDPMTDEVVQNQDGSQKTIAQQYWEDADSDFQDAQKSMTPRGAAMFREMASRTITENTQRLQGEGLRLQAQAAEQSASNTKDTYSKDFDRSFVPTQNGYYSSGVQEDGSVKQYPSAQKFFDAVQDMQLLRQRMGPVQGKPGFYGPTEVEALKQGDAQELANNWLTSAKQDLVESAGSRAALHQNLKDGSSTAVMQIHSLLDIVNGKDLQSQRRASVQGPKLPTINSSLTPDQIHRWNSDLLAMIPAAKEVDKSEYELQKANLGGAAGGVTGGVPGLDKFFQSPLFTKTLIAGGGLGLTAAERAKDMYPIISEAVKSAAISSVGGISSTEAKRKAAAEIVDLGATKYWPQLAGMIGEKDTQGFADAIKGKIGDTIKSKLDEDERQMRDHPMGYAASSTHIGPAGEVVYDSPMAHAIESRLDPSVATPGSGSVFDIFKPMSNKKSVLVNAQNTANNIGARMFGAGSNVSILQDSQFKDQAKRLMDANDPRLVETYFQKVAASGLSKAHQWQYMSDLVHKGDLPQTWVDAWNNLGSPQERQAQWAKLRAGPAPMPDGATEGQVNQLAGEHNKGIGAFLAAKWGVNSTTGRTTLNDYTSSWKEDFKQARNRGMSETEAADFADGQRDKTTGAVGVVGAQHDFFGTGWLHWGHVGPQVPVEFGANNYTTDQQQKIRDTLLHAQSATTLKQYKLATPPGALPANPNSPSDAENVASKASFWSRTGHGWQLLMQEVDKDNRPTGNSTPVQVIGPDGKPHAYEVPESAALLGAPTPAKPAVKPPPSKRNMGAYRPGDF